MNFETDEWKPNKCRRTHTSEHILLVWKYGDSLPYVKDRSEDENQIRNKKQFSLGRVSEQLQKYNLIYVSDMDTSTGSVDGSLVFQIIWRKWRNQQEQTVDITERLGLLRKLSSSGVSGKVQEWVSNWLIDGRPRKWGMDKWSVLAVEGSN